MALRPHHAEALLGLLLGGQAVAVPPEAALDPLASHGLVAGDRVLDEAGEQVAVVGLAVGERGAVVEDELLGAGALLDRALEGLVGVPALDHRALERGERGVRIDVGIGAGGRCGHPAILRRRLDRPASCSAARLAGATGQRVSFRLLCAGGARRWHERARPRRQQPRAAKKPTAKKKTTKKSAKKAVGASDATTKAASKASTTPIHARPRRRTKKP